MMLAQAVIAECSKLARHKGAWGLVWIFPLFLIVMFAFGSAWKLAKGLPPPTTAPPDAARFIAETVDLWKAVTQAPGRMLIGLFAALAFGGEYGWNTWKLVVPHSRRWRLIAAKYLAVATLFSISFVAMIVVGTLLSLTEHLWFKGGAPSGVTAWAFLQAHVRAAAAVAPAALLSIAYGAGASVLMRSTMGGSVVTILVVIGEGLAMQLQNSIERWAFLSLPGYHLNNLASWMTNGVGFVLPSKTGPIVWDLTSSLAVILTWIVFLVVVTFASFERQDLN